MKIVQTQPIIERVSGLGFIVNNLKLQVNTKNYLIVFRYYASLLCLNRC